jgi:hypothetical protein
MPIVRRAAPTPRRGWTEADRRFLRTGRDQFHRSHFSPFPMSVVAFRQREDAVNMRLVREAWADLGEQITAEWVAQHPDGTRPWAWWVCASPEREAMEGAR